MMRPLRRVLVALAGALLVAAGCSDGSRSTTETPLPLNPLPSQPPPTAKTIDITTVPEVIDLAYVSAVMDALNHVLGEAARHLYTVKRVDERVRLALQAIYSSEEYELELANFRGGAATAVEQFLRDPPGDPVTKIKSVLSSSPKCIVAAQRTDLAPLYQDTDPPLDGAVVQLVLSSVDTDPSGLNPTPWLIELLAVPKAGQDLNRACVGIQ